MRYIFFIFAEIYELHASEGERGGQLQRKMKLIIQKKYGISPKFTSIKK